MLETISAAIAYTVSAILVIVTIGRIKRGEL